MLAATMPTPDPPSRSEAATPLPGAWRAALQAAHGPARLAALPEPGQGFAGLRALEDASLVVFPAVAPDQLDRMFRLRLAQILLKTPTLEALAVVVLAGPGPIAGGFAARFRGSWPFRRTIFAAPATEVAGYRAALGLEVAALEGPVGEALESHAPIGQRIGAQFQTLWPRCGSTTAFENQVADLQAAGYFTLRVFHAPHRRPGATLDALAGPWMAENATHAGAHLNVLASARAGRLDTATLAWPGYLAAAADTPIADAEARAGLARADAVVVNHLDPMGLALRAAPAARLLLDVHDDLAQAEARLLSHAGQTPAAIAATTAITAQVQQTIWRIADLCTHCNAEEGRHVAAHARRFALILPRPYATPRPPAPTLRWDALLVGDAHPFNLAGLDWFLAALRPRPDIAALRLAVAGRAGLMRRAALEAAGIAVLGFVPDLEAVRAESRVTLASEQDGSGVAVKLLAAIAAAHPVVATAAALRGLPEAVTRLLPGARDANALAADLLGVLGDAPALAARREAVRAAARLIAGLPSYADCLARLALPTEAAIAARAADFAALIADERPPPSPIGTAKLAGGISLAAGALPPGLWLSGWHDGEDWGRWSDGAEAVIDLTLDAPLAGRVLRLELRTRPEGDFPLRVTVNGVAQPRRRVTEAGWQEWTLEDAVMAGRTRLHIALATDTAFAAARYTPGDERILGFALAGLAVR